MDNFLESRMEGLVWPALPGPMGSQMLAVLYQFEKSQWWSAETIREYQFQQLNGVWRHAISSVPYYSGTLRAAGFRRNDRITPELWSKVPILHRSQIQENEKELLSRKIPPSHGRTKVIQTSGSTGRPVRVTGTDLTNFFWHTITMRDHFWHQRDFAGKLTAIRHTKNDLAAYPGLSLPNWGDSTAPLFRTGPSAVLNSNSDIAVQAEWLRRENPDYLISYPSNLHALATFFIETGQKLPKLRQVRSFGEILGDDVRQLCLDAWGVGLVDVYSAQEVGNIALQCPDQGENYHIMAENLLVEVVDDDNRPCKSGEVGRLLLTSLNNFATPILRYEVGDYAEVGPPCPCGRGLPVLARILGRQRNMLTLPDGKTCWPSFGINTLALELSIRQFQFVQKSLDRIEVRLVTERPLTVAEEEQLTGLFAKRFKHTFKITFTYLEHIPRSTGGKFEDFMSEVANRR